MMRAQLRSRSFGHLDPSGCKTQSDKMRFGVSILHLTTQLVGLRLAGQSGSLEAGSLSQIALATKRLLNQSMKG
jgi:hypothetical protein